MLETGRMTVGSSNTLVTLGTLATNNVAHINHGQTSHVQNAKPNSAIDDAVRGSLERYFLSLEGAQAREVYDMVINAVERPMLQLIMQRADGNQLKASEILGINRNTLRKKLKAHGMIARTSN